MTKDELDSLLDAMAAQAKAQGDEALLPGLIYLNADFYGTEIRTETVSAVRGQRYRGIRIFVARDYESRVLSRAETAGLEVGAFEDLTESVPNPT